MAYSLVYPLGLQNKSRCGYCGDEGSSSSYGMWSFSLTCEDYQGLIDQGWRRSGHYIYKPNLKQTCCALYTIRLEAEHFQLSKSNRRLISRFNRFSKGEYNPDRGQDVVMGELSEDTNEKACCSSHREGKRKREESTEQMETNVEETRKSEMFKILKSLPITEQTLYNLTPLVLGDLAKMIAEPYISHCPSRQFRKELVMAKFEKESFDLYCLYQTHIHGDDPSKLDSEQYINFLVNSPLKGEKDDIHGIIYGSFHQKYYINNQLIAVGYLDILPRCVSSVYFIYHPDYAFLSMGNYSALSEIAMTTTLTQFSNQLQFYYMGYYVDTCQKMRYKGQYQPSFLLDPECHCWIPFDKCETRLKVAKYTRFCDDDHKERESSNTSNDFVRVIKSNHMRLYMNFPNSPEIDECCDWLGPELKRRIIIMTPEK